MVEHLILHSLLRWLATGSSLLLLVITVLFASFKTTAAQVPAASIGGISELRGSASVLRDQSYTAELDFSIQQLDDVRTTTGRVGITFLDDSIVRLTEHSKLVITEYIFDPNPSKGKMALKFANGTARFISSKLNKIEKQNIKLSTPTADIAIRGTDFTCTVDELGRSLIILLPDSNGLSSGEIVVTTATGSVTLNKPYQATTVDVWESSPTSPVILDLTLDIIDNMLIVSPPREDELIQEQTKTKTSSNILDIDYLQFEDLDIDYLQEDALEFTELDINYLDVNFFEDLLEIIEELDELESDNLKTGTLVQGTQLGQDLETQIITILQGEKISVQRKVTQDAKVLLDASQGYTVIFIQDGKYHQIIVNGGGTSTITIKQSSG
jgi:hypothetical protein